MIKMRALRPSYVPESRKEYAVGQEFSLKSEKDARRLERSRRAQRVADEGASDQVPDGPGAAASIESAVEDAPPFPEPETEPVIKPSRRYKRRDMKVEHED